MPEPPNATAQPPSLVATVTRLYEHLIGPRPRVRPTPPRRITDAEDREIHLTRAADHPVDALAAMYGAFGYEDRAQGTPPAGEAAIRDWLDTVLDGPGVVATHDGAVVGHVMFVPDGVGRHELAIFVHPDYQRAGIGRALLETGLAHAASRGLSKVWLTVEARNRGVEKLYCDVGFTVDDPLGPTHRLSLYL
jgi:GNAT superfamily N-acetyltransferase